LHSRAEGHGPWQGIASQLWQWPREYVNPGEASEWAWEAIKICRPNVEGILNNEVSARGVGDVRATVPEQLGVSWGLLLDDEI